MQRTAKLIILAFVIGASVFAQPPRPSQLMRALPALPAPGQVSLAVYDILGRKVATLVDGHQGEGEQQVNFSSADRHLATGIYYAVLTSSSAKRIIKMVLMQKAAGGFILGLANSRDAAVPSYYSGLVSSGCSA